MSEREPEAPPAVADAARAFAAAMLATPPAAPPMVAVRPRGDILTADEVAVWLEVNRKTVYDSASRRELPCARLGRRVIFSRAAITAWLAGGRS